MRIMDFIGRTFMCGSLEVPVMGIDVASDRVLVRVGGVNVWLPASELTPPQPSRVS